MTNFLGTEYVPTIGADNICKKSGPNRFDDVWNLPPGKNLFFRVNIVCRPIGKNAGSWARLLGTLAKMSTMCLINYIRWPLGPV